MPDLATLLLFFAGALALNFTPGPDMAFTAATAASAGRRAGVAAAAGVAAGALIWVCAAAAGLAAALAALDGALWVIQIAGGLYLLWLAATTLRRLDAAPEARGAPGPGPAFIRGVLTNLLNPKVGVFFLAFLPAFTDADAGPVWIQTAVLGAAFALTGGLVLVAVAMGAGAMRSRLANSVRIRRVVNLLAVTVFGAIGLRLLLTARSL